MHIIKCIIGSLKKRWIELKIEIVAGHGECVINFTIVAGQMVSGRTFIVDNLKIFCVCAPV